VSTGTGQRLLSKRQRSRRGVQTRRRVRLPAARAVTGMARLGAGQTPLEHSTRFHASALSFLVCVIGRLTPTLSAQPLLEKQADT